jgi:uncharacterized protein YdeI (YjbR/CyaY-like superfamily)
MVLTLFFNSKVINSASKFWKMTATDPRIDTYIERAPSFAKPVLTFIRQTVHQVCPQTQETIKWGMPQFMYKGELMCGMAAFKKHCAFGFWKASLLQDPEGKMEMGKSAMGDWGKIISISDLPSKELMASFIHQAMILNEQGIKVPKKPSTSQNKNLQMPDYFRAALESDPLALENFQRFSLSHKNEYILWIMEAKTEETRNRRLVQALEWIAQGKSRNWKYAKKKEGR